MKISLRSGPSVEMKFDFSGNPLQNTMILVYESGKVGILWKACWLILFNFLELLPNLYFWTGDYILGYNCAQL